MNRNAWSDDDRVDYDALCDEAWRYGASTAERTDHYIKRLNDAEQAHRYFAMDCLHDAVRTGASAQLKSWRVQQRKGTIPVSYEGKVLSTRRVIGSVIVDDEGNPLHTQRIFDYLTWEQLEAKAQEYAANIRAYKLNLYTVMRLIELRDLAPGAGTPAEAVEQLGTTIEEFLGGDVAA